MLELKLRRHETWRRWLLFLALALLVLFGVGIAGQPIPDRARAIPGSAGCKPTITGDRAGEGGTTHRDAYDGSLITYFDSTHDNWQYIQIDFKCVGTFSAIRRHMTTDGSSSAGNRGLQGEAVSYSLDGTNWTSLTDTTTNGWESYVNYSGGDAWHSVVYGWSAWLNLNTPAQARYVRFRWDDNRDAVNEIELAFVEVTPTPMATSTPTPTSTATPTATSTPRSVQDTDRPRFDNFAPSGWVTAAQTVEVSVDAQDYGAVVSGLDPDSAEYSYSSDAGVTWRPWMQATVSFPYGSTQAETISANTPFGTDSEEFIREGDALTRVRFRISDVAGNAEVSRDFPVHIDTTPPQVPPNLRSTTHQPGVVSTDRVIWATWVRSYDASSGVSQYWVDWLRTPDLPGGDCPFLPTASAVARNGPGAISPSLADGDDWYICVWTQDNAGHWAIKPASAGPYWIDATPPGPVANLSSSTGTARWTNQSSVAMSWSPPPDGDIAGYAYVWDNAASTTPTTAVTTTLTTVTTPLSTSCQPNWYFHVAAFDRAGNMGAAEHFGPLGMDQVPPYAPFITDPPLGWIKDNTPTAVWSTTDRASCDSGIGLYEVIWQQDGTDVQRQLTTSTTATSAPLPDGEGYAVRVMAWDGAGNRSPVSLRAPFHVDTGVPSCSIVPNSTIGSNTRSVTLWVQSQDPPHPDPWVSLRVRDGQTGPWTTISYGPRGNRTYSGQHGHTYYFQCRAEDLAGNQSGWLPDPPTTSATIVLPDLRPAGLEWTQAVQTANNAVPLVGGKRTMVRLFVEADYPSGTPYDITTALIPNVTAYLHGLRNGAPLPGSPLQPTNGTLTWSPMIGSQRIDLGTTLNFRLPTSWRQAPLTLRGEVNPVLPGGIGRIADESITSNNVTAPTSPTFSNSPTGPLPVVVQRLQYTISGTVSVAPAALPAGLQSQRAYARAALPFSDVILQVPPGGDILNVGAISLPVPTYRAIQDLAAARSAASSPWDDRIWYGVVPDNFKACDGSFCAAGRGNQDEQVAWGFRMDSAGQRTFAHELYHVFMGGGHSCDTIGDIGVDLTVGNTRLLRSTTLNFMAYTTCGNISTTWISRNQYQTLMTAPQSAAASLSPRAATTQGDAVVISGHVSPEGAAALDTVLRLPDAGATEALGAGPYQIQLLDAADRILASRRLDLPPPGEEGHDGFGAVFAERLPFPAGAVRVRLSRDGTVLAERTASSSPPRVTLLSPAGGETLHEPFDVVWTAEDADGDDLRHSLFYSTDGGDTWSLLALNLAQTRLRVDPTDFAGSQEALIRVVASDGFHSASDEADDVLQVPDHAPQAYITAPTNGAFLGARNPANLEGWGFDREDGNLAPERLAWRSNRDGLLGMGREVFRQDLSEGWHTITLTVTDGDNRQASASVRVYVGPVHRVFLPTIGRR